MGFSVLMVVGDKKGKVGLGLGKAKDVISAIRKGVRQAKKKMISVPIDGTTIPFEIEAKHGAGKVLLKPASKGSGVIAGGPVRAVVEAAGIRDVSAKILGSENQASSVYATFKALKQTAKIIKIRGIKVTADKSVLEEEVIQAQSARSGPSTKTNRPAKIGQGARTGKTAQPSKVVQTGKVTTASKVAKSTKIVKPAASVKSTKPTKPTTTKKLSKAAEPAKPAKLEEKTKANINIQNETKTTQAKK